jgi:hypothetical protein
MLVALFNTGNRWVTLSISTKYDQVGIVTPQGRHIKKLATDLPVIGLMS